MNRMAILAIQSDICSSWNVGFARLEAGSSSWDKASLK